MPLLPDIGQRTLIARNIATVARYWANNLFLGVLLPDIGQITLFFKNIALLLNKFFSFSFFLLVARYWASYTVSRDIAIVARHWTNHSFFPGILILAPTWGIYLVLLVLHELCLG